MGVLRIFWGKIQRLGVCKCDVLCIAETEINAKKKTLRSSQGKTERVQKLRIEYWEKVKQIDPEDLVFIDEMGVLLGLTRTHARGERGTRVYDFKPYYRKEKISVIGGISFKKVLAVMTLNGSMDKDAYKVFVEHFLLPQLWVGAVVVIDNLPAHKVEEIKPGN